jgi:hypothetical protein
MHGRAAGMQHRARRNAGHRRAGVQAEARFHNVQLSEMRPPTLERRWTATVTADASRCATTAGYFEVGISRLKEIGTEVEFREQFIWSSPAVLIGIDFWADEAVEAYWVDSIQACPCAEDMRAPSGLLPPDTKPN